MDIVHIKPLFMIGIMEDLPEDILIEYIFKEHVPELSTKWLFTNLGTTDYSMSDENILRLMDTFNHYVTRIMTKEQVIKFYKTLGIDVVAKSQKMSLDELDTMFPGERLLLPPLVFHTEEDIRKYPQFFNPKSSGINRFYFTKDTLKILNKTWGTRQRYDSNNGNASKLLIRNSYKLTPDIIRYLESKEIDWGYVFRGLIANIKNYERNDTRLAIIGKLLNKYQD